MLRENILISAAKKVIIMADSSKFVKNFNRTIPVEVQSLARQMFGKKLRNWAVNRITNT